MNSLVVAIFRKEIREILRVTKADGTIMIVDYDLPRNKISRELIYRLVTLYEGEYYRDFIASNLEALLAETGIEVLESISVLFGAARVLKGTRAT